MSDLKYVSLSAFKTFTTFEIDPRWMGVVSSAYPGCIEVHLQRYDHQSQSTAAGGKGLAIAGKLNSINRFSRLHDRYALIAGFDEVFEVACFYDGVVVLRPLGVGLGVRWKLFRNHQQAARKIAAAKQPRKNLADRHEHLSGKFHRAVQLATSAITGRIADQNVRDEDPFVMQIETRDGVHREPLGVRTLDEARQLVKARVARIAERKWKCGEPGCVDGTINRPSASTVSWLCLRDDQKIRVSIKIRKAEDTVEKNDRIRGRFRQYSPAEIADMFDTWARFDGFCGETCSNC